MEYKPSFTKPSVNFLHERTRHFSMLQYQPSFFADFRSFRKDCLADKMALFKAVL